MAYVIRSSRFEFGDNTEYPTREAAYRVVRDYVQEHIRRIYRIVFRLYEGRRTPLGIDPGDGYGWVYWDETKPARLWVEPVRI